MSNIKPWKPKDMARSSRTTPSGDDSSPERTTRPAGTGQSFVFSLDHRPRATRASVPKVRSGCITCKRRHVKCDEAKPACQRCLKWQGFCDGYRPTDSRSPKRDQKRRQSTSSQSEKGDSTASGAESQGSQSDSNIQPHFPSSAADTTEVESLYFNNWLNLASNLGGGLFSSPLFTETIPQMSNDEIAIRYAIIAVGALVNALSPDNPIPFSSLSAGAPHYDTALTYHGHALRLIRLQNESTNPSSVRVAVIACIVFTIFEVVHGSYEAAIEHINHGGLMIASQLLEEQGIGVPQSVFEDEILQVFQRLNYLAWSTRLLDPSRTMPRMVPTISNNLNISRIPSRFSSPREAKKWLESLEHRSIHFTQAVTINIVTMPSPISGDQLHVPNHVVEMQQEHLRILDGWKTAFWPLLASTNANYKRDGVPMEYLQAISLLLQFTVLQVSIKSFSFLDNRALQQATPESREIIQLAEIILSSQTPAIDGTEVFTMDNGPTFALFVAATKCTDIDVRNKAVGLVRQYPRRDAFWDSRVALAELMNRTDITQENLSAIDPRLAQIE